MKYGFAPILVLVIILIFVLGLIGYVGYQAMGNPRKIIDSEPTQISPFPNPTANWKTYTSPELKITFQYPSDWYIDTGRTELEIAHIRVLSFKPEYLKSENEPEPLEKLAVDITNWSARNTQINSVDEMKKYLSDLEKEPCYDSKSASWTGIIIARNVSQKDVNGSTLYTRATKCSTSSEPESISNYFLDGMSNIVLIQTAYQGNVDLKVLDQILSTFRFLSDPAEAPGEGG